MPWERRRPFRYMFSSMRARFWARTAVVVLLCLVYIVTAIDGHLPAMISPMPR